jgi:SAM-dependent methyltransferase
MTTTPTDADWRVVDRGWGRAAVDFATLSEPANCREYVAMHHRLRVDEGDHLLDMACGAGLAIELAALRGASCAGIDASPRLVAVARDRTPAADVRVGDMAALPWADASFDVVTSFRGIWGTTEVALGRPGAGEEILARHGLIDIRRVDVPFAWEFPDPETYARALLSTGPAYEAVQHVGEAAFRDAAVSVARERVRQGLPLRARIAVAGFVARRPGRPA